MSSVRAISAEDFARWTPSLKVIDHDHARRYAALKLSPGGIDVALSWRSDMVEPILVRDVGSGVVWAGIDERVVCVALDGKTLFSLGVPSPVLDIRPFPQCIAILCETCLLVVNSDYSIQSMAHLNDVPDTIALVDGHFVITFADGTRQRVS